MKGNTVCHLGAGTSGEFCPQGSNFQAKELSINGGHIQCTKGTSCPFSVQDGCNRGVQTILVGRPGGEQHTLVK